MRTGHFILLAAVSLIGLSLCGCTKLDMTIDRAVEESNPQICNEMEKASERQDCFDEVAREMRNPQVCRQSKNMNGCITGYATAFKDDKYCAMIPGQTDQLSCKATVAGNAVGDAVMGFFEELGQKQEEQCLKGCKDAGDACRMGCVIAQGKALEKCDEDIGDNTTIAYEYCSNSAMGAFSGCVSGCFADEDDCERGC